MIIIITIHVIIGHSQERDINQMLVDTHCTIIQSYTCCYKIRAINSQAKNHTWTIGFLEKSLLDLLSCTSNR